MLYGNANDHYTNKKKRKLKPNNKITLKKLINNNTNKWKIKIHVNNDNNNDTTTTTSSTTSTTTSTTTTTTNNNNGSICSFGSVFQ